LELLHQRRQCARCGGAAARYGQERDWE